ncbi:MAG: hypothetical protein U0232_23795 [Thermomicrobiales bacterium]
MATRRSLARLRSSGPAIGELFKIVRELSFDELREEAQLPPRLLLVGANHDRLPEHIGRYMFPTHPHSPRRPCSDRSPRSR